MGRIDTELHIIQNNRYGEDVRMAIHDALDKLEKTSGGGGEKTTNVQLFASSIGEIELGNTSLVQTQIDISTDDLESGDINGSTGADSGSSAYYVRVKNNSKIEIPDSTMSVQLNVSVNTGYTPKFYCHCYDANGSYLSYSYNYYNGEFVSQYLFSGTKYIRLVIQYTTSSTVIYPSHIESLNVKTS